MHLPAFIFFHAHMHISSYTHQKSRMRKVSKLAKRHCWPKRQRIYSTFIRNLWIHQCVLCIFLQVISFNIIPFIVCRKTFRYKCRISRENPGFCSDAMFENPLRPWKAPFIVFVVYILPSIYPVEEFQRYEFVQHLLCGELYSKVISDKMCRI